MSTHNIYFLGEIRKISIFFQKKKSAFSGDMAIPTLDTSALDKLISFSALL